MTFPNEHYQIVKALVNDGRFLLEGEAPFLCLREQQDFYQAFFWESFRLRLVVETEYALLQSSRDTDNLARAICIFLAVFCYELDHTSDNLLESLAFGTFSIEEWEERFEQSAYQYVLEATDYLRNKTQRRRFYQSLQRRAIIHLLDEDKFQFTPAHRYFLDFARDLNMRGMLQADEQGGDVG
jgi:hypothetical protein